MSKFEAEAYNISSNSICASCSLCTYALSGNQLVFQSIYICETCNTIESGICCCLGCSTSCHNGHDIRFLAFGKSYCDCGASGCKLYTDSITSATFALNNSNSKEFFNHAEIPVTANNIVKTFNIRETSNILNVVKHQSLNLVTKSKDTFWLDASSIPRCQIEFLVKQIFAFHTQNMNILNNISECGAEWWIQVKDLSNDSTAGESTAIDLHYDKDEEIASLFSVGVFPLVSTVTYLCDEKASPQPTVIFSNLASDPVGKTIPLCTISYPKFGKHISFDGNLLHGAPSHPLLRQLPDSSSPMQGTSTNASDSLRVTLLVNIWIGHHPAGLQALPLSLVEEEVVMMMGVGGKEIEARKGTPQLVDLTYTVCIEPMLSLPYIRITSDDVDMDEDDDDDDDDDEKVDNYKNNPLRKSNNASSTNNTNNMMSDINEGKKASNGNWLDLPFVSDDSIWGKDEEETGLRLSMWLPSKDIIKKKMSIISSGKSPQPTNSSAYDMSTLVIEYADEDCGACLIYDEEEVEETNKLFDQGLVNMSVF